MPKSIAVIVTNKNEDIEVIAPIDIWRRAGFKVITYSIADKLDITLAHGTKFIADEMFDLEKIEKSVAVYFPGGEGYKDYFKYDENSEFIKMLKSEFIDDEEKYLISACAAPMFLAKVGLINGRNYTCYPGFEKEFPDTYKNENVVSHENLITGKGPCVSFELAFKVIEKIMSKEKADELAKAMIYNSIKDSEE